MVSASATTTIGTTATTEDKTSERTTTNTISKGNERRVVPQEVLNLLTGGIAGMSAKSVVAPIDRIKILYQSTDAKFRLRHVPAVATSIIRVEGVTALWKGNAATLVRVFPYSGVQFMTFDYCKQYFLMKRQMELEEVGGLYGISRSATNNTDLTPVENLASGMCAGVVSVLCTYPLDLTRAQLAVNTSTGTGSERVTLGNTLAKNFRHSGVAGLYRGLLPTMLGILPYSSLAFTINEQSKNKIKNDSNREPTTIEKMQCGAISGVVAQSLTYPLEVIRRRMQTYGHVSKNASNHLLMDKSSNSSSSSNTAMNHKTSSSHNNTNNYHSISMSKVIRQLYKQEGVGGFFKGLSMNWMKGPIAFSISFTTYDVVKTWIHNSLYGNDI